MKNLLDDYAQILKGINVSSFNLDEDKYSGVFLPEIFEEYWSSTPKIMLVGRETMGWNIASGVVSGKLKDFNGIDNTVGIVEAAINRYRKHLKIGKNGKLLVKTKSRFKQYFFRIAKEVGVNPSAIIYANLFAWDYNKKSPVSRPEQEVNEITSVSQKLLAAQIRHVKPDFIVFATGYEGIDPVIKGLFNVHFDGYESLSVEPKKFWQFKAAGAICFRIAHPRATHGHGAYRDQVIQQIKNSIGA